MSKRSVAARQRADEAAQQRRAAAARRQRLLLVGGAMVAAIAVAVVLILLNRPESNDGLLVDPLIAPPLDAAIPVMGRAMGDLAAPVTVVEWGDYQ